MQFAHGAGTEILDESGLSGNFTDEYVFFGGKRIARRNIASGTRHSVVRRVVIWSLAVGCASTLVAVKGSTTFGASDWKAIAVFFAGGCGLGALLGLLTTAYNEKRKTLFHIWGWSLLLALFGLVFNTGTLRGYVLGTLIGASVGASIGSVLYSRVSRGVNSGGGFSSN